MIPMGLDDRMTIAHRLKEIRTDNDLTQKRDGRYNGELAKPQYQGTNQAKSAIYRLRG